MKYKIKLAKDLKVGDICGHDNYAIWFKILEIEKDHRVTIIFQGNECIYDEEYYPKDKEFFVEIKEKQYDDMGLDFL